MTEITERVKTGLTEAAKNIHNADQRFYNLGILVRLAAMHEKYGLQCEQCRKELKNIIMLSEKADYYVNESNASRKKLEEIIAQSKSHLKKEHQITQHSYFSSLYTIYGLIAGTVIGIAVSFILPLPQFEVIFIAIALGLIIFRIIGSRKDSVYKKQGKQL